MAPTVVIQGREAIRAALLTRPKTLLTKHLATNVMIDVESRDEAARTVLPDDDLDDAAGRHGRRRTCPRDLSTSASSWIALCARTASGRFLERRGSIQMKFCGPVPAG